MKILWLLSNVTKDNIILVQLFLSYSWFFIFNRVSDGDIVNAGTLDSFKISVNQLKIDNASFVYRHSRAVLQINKILFRTSKTNYQKVKAAVLSRYENT